MENTLEHIPREQRKKILLLCDDIRVNSGIGNMGKEIVIGTAHHYNWVNLGAAVKHPDQGKVFDLSQQLAKESGVEDAYLRLIPNTGYGDAMKVRELLRVEKPDALLIFTDPRYWTWLFEIEREIRSQVPIFYYSIWDNWPLALWNQSYYESCDLHMCISKQTKAMTKMLLDRCELEVIDIDTSN